MDPVQQPISLRETVLHHRWIGDQPVFSFRTIARRHIDPDSVFLRFLSYNTYLMRVLVALAKALADFAGPVDVLKALGVEPRDVLRKVSGGQLCDAVFPGDANPLRPACKAAGDAVNYVLDQVAPEGARGGNQGLGAEYVVELVLKAVGVPSEVTLQRKPALISTKGLLIPPRR